MPVLYNALDLVKGKKPPMTKGGTLIQPLQFLPQSEKDDEWLAHNMDWFEWKGVKQLKRNAGRLLKWYKLAEGEIDKSDYIVGGDNELGDVVEYLQQEDSQAMQLKFYPLAPLIVKVFRAEFAKRTSKIQFRAVDDLSISEREKEAENMIEEYLLKDASQKMMEKMISKGVDPNSPEAQQAMAPEQLKSLPEIQAYFQKTYRSRVEQWCMHQHKANYQRFHMNELEERAFRDMLVADREFWHFRMMEDDYELEVWNPLQTFYRKSPDSRYISQSSYAGMVDLMTVADALDKFGWMMTSTQMESLENFYPSQQAVGLQLDGLSSDNYYNKNRSHEWNTEGPSVNYRKFIQNQTSNANSGDIIHQILNESEDLQYGNNSDLVRVTTLYWKSQKKLFHLTEIDESGQHIEDMVDESFKVTTKPIYDTTIFKEKSSNTLVFGQHLEAIWINETYGGIKLGPNRASYWGMNNPSSMSPIYLGTRKGKPGRIPFQFKGNSSLYGCKIPVEGAVFTDRNVKSASMVGEIYPYQVTFNMVNNQIADILIDEQGPVVLMDQNALPKQSLGEDWGKNRYANAYMAMKQFGILPVDTSLENTGAPLSFQHYQPIDLSQTARLRSRVELALHFKQQALETVGFNGARLGQPIGKQDTATGIENDLNASYAQTEMYFVQHSDYLMPRVYQMDIEVSQYYQSNNPSARLSYNTTLDDQIHFNLLGMDLLPREINVFCSTTVNSRAIQEQLKQLAIHNNTLGATMADLGNVLKADSLAEVDLILKGIEAKNNQQRQETMQQEKQMHDEELAQEQQLKQLEWDRDDRRQAVANQTAVLVAEIRAASMGSMVDLNANGANDYQDALDRIEKQDQFRDTMGLKREQEVHRNNAEKERIKLGRDKIAAENNRAAKDLQIARMTHAHKESQKAKTK